MMNRNISYQNKTNPLFYMQYILFFYSFDNGRKETKQKKQKTSRQKKKKETLVICRILVFFVRYNRLCILLIKIINI